MRWCVLPLLIDFISPHQIYFMSQCTYTIQSLTLPVPSFYTCERILYVKDILYICDLQKCQMNRKSLVWSFRGDKWKKFRAVKKLLWTGMSELSRYQALQLGAQFGRHFTRNTPVYTSRFCWLLRMRCAVTASFCLSGEQIAREGKTHKITILKNCSKRFEAF